MRHWSALAALAADGSLQGVRLVALVSSLEVVRGHGGVKPLSSRDKATIVKTAVKALHGSGSSEIVYETGPVPLTPGTHLLAGTLTIAGTTRPLDLDLKVNEQPGGTGLQVRGSLLQTDFGIKPYRALLGALAVRDLVQVRADLVVPHPG